MTCSIVDLLLAPATGAFFFDDQAALRRGAVEDGQFYTGEPITTGFRAIRQPADFLGVGLVLSDGTVCWGDCAGVQYSGAAGRDPLFDRTEMRVLFTEVVRSRLLDRPAAALSENCAACFEAGERDRLPKAVEYGVSQALLRAAAHARALTMAEVLCEEFALPAPLERVPIFAQSGDERRANVDKMILKRVDALPHGLINSREKFGEGGHAFADYVRWVAQRIRAMGPPGYRPVLHFDTYGWVGIGIGLDPAAIAKFCARLGEEVPDFSLYVECPADFGSLEAQLEGYAAITAELARLGSPVRIVADEYCNTLDDVRRFCDARAGHMVQIKTPDLGSLLDTVRAILYARAAGVEAYSGGTSAETDLSARVCVHAAVAARATMMLAKPGMGFDEGFAIVANEQARLLATMRAKHGREPSA